MKTTKKINLILWIGAIIFFSYINIASAIYGETSPIGGDTATQTLGYTGDSFQVGDKTLFNKPTQVLSYSGVLYISDSMNNCIRQVSSTGIITSLAGLCGDTNYGYQEGTGTGARFNTPTGLAIKSDGTVLYVSDTGNNKIRAIDLTTNTTSLIAGSTVGYAEGISGSAQFNYPYGMVYYNSKLYVADKQNHKIRAIDLITNTTSLIAGSVDGYSEGTGSIAKFSYPTSLDINTASGILYVGEMYKVRKIDLSTNVTSLIAGSIAGTANGAGAAAQFNNIQGISYDKYINQLYISDKDNSRVRVINLVNNISADFVGSGDGYLEGMTTFAKFKRQSMIYFDNISRILYVGDSLNNLIRKIDVNYYQPIIIQGVKQYDIYNTTEILPKGTTTFNGMYVYLKFQDNDLKDDFIDVEIKKTSDNFDGTTNIISVPHFGRVNGTVYEKRVFVGQGIIENGNSYHWRYRIRGVDGTTQGWQEYGMNATTSDDIIIPPMGIYDYNSTTSFDYTQNLGSLYPKDVLYSTNYMYTSIGNCVLRYNKNLGSDDYSGTGFIIAGNCSTAGNIFNTGGLSARFNNPQGLAIDETNNYLYVADYGNNSIKRIDLISGNVTILAGSISGVAGDIDLYGIDARLNNPFKLELSKDNSILYFTDYTNKKLKKVDLTNNNVSTLYTTTYNPYGVTLDKDNNILYFTDTYRGWLDGGNRNTSGVSTLGIRSYDIGKNQFSMVYRKVLRFWNYSPMDIYYDSVTKSIYSTYVGVSGNPRGSRTTFFIEKIDTVGMVGSTISSNGYNPGCSNQRNYSTCNYYGYKEGYGTTSLYYTPNSITYDSDSKKILVSDYENKRFRIIKNLNIVPTTPYILNYTPSLYDINNTLLVSGATITNSNFKIRFQNPGFDSNALNLTLKYEVEVKPIGIDFDGNNLYTLYRKAYSDDYITFGPNLQGAYHIRYKISDQLYGYTTGWKTIGTDDKNIADIKISSSYAMNTISYVTNNFSQDKYNDILSASGYVYVSSNSSCIYRFPKNIYTPDFLNTTNTSDFYSKYLLAGSCGTAGNVLNIDRLSARFNDPRGLAIDETNKYLYVADWGNNEIKRIDLTSGIVTLVAGSVTGIAGDVDNIGTDARLNNPFKLELSKDNSILYFTDYTNKKLKKIDLTNNNVSTLYTTTYNPYGVTLDKDNNILYFTDTYRGWLDGGNRNTSGVSTLGIRSYDIGKNQFSMVYRKVLRFWNYSPMDIYYDSVTKSIYSTYVGVSGNPRGSRTTFFIEKIDTVGMVGSTISSNGYNPGCSNQRNYSTCNYYGYREGYGTTSLYYTPNSITYDSDSKKILVSDYENRLIREISGTKSSVLFNKLLTSNVGLKDINSNVLSYGSGITNSAFKLNFDYTNILEDSNQNITLKYEVELKPIGTNFDGSGTIITSSNITKSPTDIVIGSLSNGSYHIRYRITDIGDDTIGSSLTTDWKNIGGNDESVADIVVTSSYTMNTNSYFTNNFTQSKYNDVLISSGYVYISSNAGAIYKVPKDMQAQFLGSSTMSDFNRKFLLSGNINTYGNLYNTTKERALFNDPRGLAIDETNKYLYIADWGNNEIKRIDLTSGIVTLVAGSVTGIAGDVDNIGTDARLNNPFKLELSKDNSILYFTDYTNKKLKKVDLTNNNVSTLYTTANNPYGLSLDKDNNILYFVDHARGWRDSGNYNAAGDSSIGIRSYDIGKNQFSMVYRKIQQFWNHSPMDIYYDSITKSIYATYVGISRNRGATSFFVEKIDTVGMVGTTISSSWYNPGCSSSYNYASCSYYGYREGYGTTPLYYTPNSITYDSDSKKILVSDYENRLIREINTRTYEAPINVAMQLYDIDGTTLGGAAITPKGNAFRIMTRISDADAVDSNRVEIEMKDIYTPFNGSGTFQTPYYYTTKGVNTDIYYTVGESQVIAGKSYHIRIRPVDVNGNTGDWKYYLGNNDVGVNGNTVSDEDITIGNFNLDNQYGYILGVADSNNNSYSNGVYVYAPDTKVSYKAYNYVGSNITNLYTDNQYVYFFNGGLFYKIDKTSGDMYYISNFPSLYSYTIDKTNNYIYWTDKTSIFRYDIIAKTHTKLTGTLSTTGYIEGSPGVAQFNLISSISLSENGKSLYIADTNNNRIRKLDLDISSATYLSTSLVLGSGLADSTKDVSGTGILANIYHPYNVFVSAGSNYLFVSSNDATYAKIYKLDIASNYGNIIRTNIPGISGFRNWGTDDKYVYFMISGEIYKMSTDINLPSQIKILSKHAAYQEGVNGKLTAYSDYYFDGDTLFFVDNYSKIRKINYKYTGGTRSIGGVVSSIIQRESDNATPISTGATTQSQTMYLLANYTYPYQFHLKTQIEIKELGVDFNGTGLIEGDWQFYDAGAKTMQAFLTNDDIQQYKNYHWRVRTVDSYGNISDWYNAFNNSEGQADFVVGGVKVGQTNIVPVRLPGEVRKIPLNTLESFNYSLVDNALDGSVKGFYYVAGNCIRYFDYKQFSANRYNYSYTNYTTDFFCNSTISTINGKLKFSIDKTKMYLHSALKVYQLDLTSKDFTLLAGSTSGDVNGVPSASSFSNITDVTQLNKGGDTRCMLVTDKGNNKVKIFPISGTPSSCKGLVNDGTDNGWVEDWYIGTGFDCLYQTKDTNWLYVNGGKLSTATKGYTAVTGGFTCINDTIDSEEAYYYTYEGGVIRNVSLQQLSSNTIIKSKITGAGTSGYFEGPKDYSKFTSITAMIRDPMNSRLYVNDAGKFRTVELNSTYAPTISGLSSTSFKTGDQITITGSYLIEIGYGSGSLPMSEVQNGNFYILMGDIRLAYSDILYWTDNEIKVKVPYGVKDGKMIIKTPSGMSNSINFAISNPPTIFDISPYSFHVGDGIIITGDYFGVKNASSKVEITYSGATTVGYKLMTINSWADNSINVTVPTEAVTGNIKVTTQYGSYTYNISILNGRPPAKPILKSPGNLTTAVSITPTLLTNAYYNIDNNSQQASEWVVIDRNSSSEVFHTPADTYNLTQITVPSGKLYKGKSYLWKVRFQDNKSNWSDWSDVRGFTTDTTSIVAGNMAPNTPTNISPVNNSTGVTVTGLNLSASAYQDGDTDPAKQTAQSSSFWQIRKLSSSYSYAVLSQTKSSDFSNFAVPNGVLQDSTWYCWRVNYTDGEGLASNYSPETCFATAGTTRATPPPTATNNTNTSGTYTIAPIVYDKPNKPSGFGVTLDNSSYTVNLASNSYTDSNIDSLSGSEDKLGAVEWEVLYYNNTDTTLTTDTDGFITDSVLANVNFSTAKKYRKIRQNCAVPENEGNVGGVCLLNYSIPYNILGLKGTYLVRERHMDEYNTWSDSSGIKKFYIDKIPTSSMFYGNIRSVANLSLNIIGNTNNMTYNWTSDTLPNGTPGDFKPIAQCSAASDYMRYTHCLVSGTKTYGYIIGQGTSKLKFEPIVSGNYKFNVNVSNGTVTKAKLLEVNVQK